MSMHSFYIDSDGNEVDSPHAYLHAQDRLAKEQRKLSHMKKGSSNYQKQKLKIAKLYAKPRTSEMIFCINFHES